MLLRKTRGRVGLPDDYFTGGCLHPKAGARECSPDYIMCI